MGALDILHKIATIIIAAGSLYFSIYIFNSNRKNQAIDKEKDRNFQSLKIFVLDHSLKYLYQFFDDLPKALNKFKVPGLSDKEKELINEEVGDSFILLRRRFTDLLFAIDDKLYGSVLDKSDNFQQHITESVFDNGINLTHTPKFEEILMARHNDFKIDVIKVLLQYKG